MKWDQVKELALKLCKAESEEEVIDILIQYDLWNPMHWKYFGQNENNYSTIGNQQSDAIAALIEKLINSADAILMKECLKRNIIPQDRVNAPHSTKKALEEFFNIKDGDICNLTDEELRSFSSENLLLVATSKDGNYKNFKPCLAIIDDGEGQFPNTMEDTFLSIGKSNKLSISFVQGKFNMGGTGVLPFCGKNKIQLILTKRNIDIAQNSDNEFKDYWGLTIVRKQEPQQGQRSSSYTYLAPDGEILKFKSDELPIRPNIEDIDECIPYKEPMKCGTFIKLYDYDMKSYGYKKITMTGGLTDRLNMMISKASIPIRLIECRGKKDKVKDHTKQQTVKGYEARLHPTNKKAQNNIEENFPINTTITKNKQNIELTIYAFKEGKHKSYKKSGQSIVFTVNGQTQGFISDSIFTRKKVGLESIKDSIFVIADCTNIETSYLEELFMNSRDRLRESDFAQDVEKAIENALSENYALKDLRDKRKREMLKDKTEDNKLLTDSLKKLLKENPDIKNILGLGADIEIKDEKEIEYEDRDDFIGKDYPTFFNIKSRVKERIIEKSLGKKFIIKIETDVKNGFFDNGDKGKLIVRKGKKEIENCRFNLDRGIIDLSIDVGKKVKVNDLENYSFEIVTFKGDIFKDEFNVLFKEKQKRNSTVKKGDKSIKKKTVNIKQETTQKVLLFPKIIEVTEKDFEKYDMKSDSSLKILKGDTLDDAPRFFINMDNRFIKEYVKKVKVPVMKEQMLNKYKMITALYGISLLNSTENNKNCCDNYDYFVNTVDISSKALAQVCFAMDSLYKQLDLDS